jgi:hypothetical protein
MRPATSTFVNNWEASASAPAKVTRPTSAGYVSPEGVAHVGEADRGELGELAGRVTSPMRRKRPTIVSGPNVVMCQERTPARGYGRLIFGGCSRTRTCDPLIKSQLLYHLSYTPCPYRSETAGSRVLAKGPSAVHQSSPDLKAARLCKASRSPRPEERARLSVSKDQIIPLERLGTATPRCTCTLIRRPKPNITVIIALPP